MTTATQPRARGPQTKAHDDLRHGPVAAAVSSSSITMFVTTIGKLAGLPPWLAVLGGTIMSVALVWAGRHRRPRPLSGASLTYRAAVMLTATGWIFWQMADFPDTAGVGLGLGATGVAVLLIPVGFWAMKFIAGPWKITAPVVGAVLASFLVVAFGPRLMAWIVGTLTTTDRLPCCRGNINVLLPWLGYSTLSIIIIAAPLAVLGVSFANRERAADDEMVAARRDMDSNSLTRRAAWMQRMVCNEFNEWTEIRDPGSRQVVQKIPNVLVTEWHVWANGAGEDYIFDLRGSQRGLVPTRVNAAKEVFVTKLGLPDGCGVEVLGAGDKGRGFIKLSVSRKNTIKDKFLYPELMPRSILNALPVGVLRSGVEIGPVLRESSAYVWGQKGSGKTVTIFDLIAGAIQCTDCLVWGIDLNGGAAFAPFLSAWEDGDVDRPCIDWVAATIQEVRRMAETALEIAIDRKRFYRKLKKEHNTNLMPVGNGAAGNPPPEILIIIDEGAEVLGLGGGKMTDDAREAREALDAIMRLARDAAINIIFSGLRATSDVADPAFKAGTSVRIGMRVTDQQELAYGFGDWKLDPAEIPYQGSGFISIGHESDTQAFKAYFLDPQAMERAGLTCTPWRPYLDARGVQVGGATYANRWRRTARNIFENPREELVQYGGLVQLPAGPTAAGAPARPNTVDDDEPFVYGGGTVNQGASMPTGGDGFDGMMAAAKRLREAERDSADAAADGATPPAPPAGAATPAEPEPDFGEETSQQEFDARFEQLAKQFSTDPATWVGAVPLPPDAELAAQNVDSRAVLESLVRQAGPAGIPWTVMHTALRQGGDWGPAVKITTVAMGKLLKKPGSGERVDWLAPRENGKPYVHIEHHRPTTE